MKRKITISVNDNLIEWCEKKKKEKEFASISHAVQKALTLMREKYELEERA